MKPTNWDTCIHASIEDYPTKNGALLSPNAAVCPGMTVWAKHKEKYVNLIIKEQLTPSLFKAQVLSFDAATYEEYQSLRKGEEVTIEREFIGLMVAKNGE
jgi:hypothetical protein